MSSTDEADEAEKVKILKEKLRAIGFIAAAALTEPDEKMSQKFSGLAETLLNKFLVTLVPEEDRDTVTDHIEDFAVQAYEEFQL
jgi:hypothetical protein